MRVQLHRALSKLGFCSRTQAIVFIKEGKVRINGTVAHNPLTWVDTKEDKVQVVGMAKSGVVNKKNKNGRDTTGDYGDVLPHQTKLYCILHKPKGYVTTCRDEKNRRTIYDLLPDTKQWIFPVGRLDMDSEGLLILTNDGPWGQRLLDPEFHVEKEYLMWLDQNLIESDWRRLEEGIVLEGTKTLPCRIMRRRELDTETRCGYSIILQEGRNRQIRKMFELLGYKVKKLVRIRIGSVVLGDLGVGKMRELTEGEVRRLRFDRGDT